MILCLVFYFLVAVLTPISTLQYFITTTRKELFLLYKILVKQTYKTGFSKIVVITRLFWGDALVLQVSIGQLVWNCFLARKIALSFGLSTASLSTTAVPKNITIFKVGGLDVARGPVRGAHVR